MLESIEKHSAQGLNEEQIAHSLGIGYSTFQRKKKDTGEIGERIKRGRSKGIGTITNKLFQRAQGFNIEEDKVFCFKGKIITHTVKRYFPPDLGAMAFYLKNRDPENWKDQRHIEETRRHVGLDTEITSEMTPQEAADSYADTLRQGNGGNVIPIKRRK
jgi:hypothetical protein